MAKYKTHTQIMAEMMEDPAFKAAYEAELRKERLQNTLEQWRTSAGLTRADLAKILGVTPSTVSRMEKNVTRASIDTLARYAQACGIEHPSISL
ncbi:MULTISPECIES: helix-turn-helix domain-containing protein [Photorhabdus]|uniref:Putative transcriptional regulator n=1 Tax=Photorhabdus aegyptia TaxID=2805098 RepID=A0A022PLG8_9GAMM|nr:MULTISPECIES: helix-turn-helix transcriptional regulator [Photorhabdus]EYU16364.1 putative transcriptional regulator [Photorhabdus aegyptia]